MSTQPNIRKAGFADLDEVVRLGASFHALGPYAFIPLDREAFRTFASALIQEGVIFLSEDGMLGGLLSPMYFNPAVKGAAELFWYARSGGDALRQAFEAWGRENGASVMQFSGLANDKERASRRLFKRAGYDATEVAFLKRVA